jgi:hypothetical protein
MNPKFADGKPATFEGDMTGETLVPKKRQKADGGCCSRVGK